MLPVGTRYVNKNINRHSTDIPVDTGLVVGVLVDFVPLTAALLPDDDPPVVAARRQDVPEPWV